MPLLPGPHIFPNTSLTPLKFNAEPYDDVFEVVEEAVVSVVDVVVVVVVDVVVVDEEGGGGEV